MWVVGIPRLIRVVVSMAAVAVLIGDLKFYDRLPI
jgi:hypothetical protein